MSNSILDKIAIEVDEPEAIAKSLRSEALKPVAEAYSKNINNILGLLSLPYMMLGQGIRDSQRLHFYLQAVAETKILLKSKEDHEKVIEYAKRLFKQAEEDSNSPRNSDKEITRQLSDLLKFDMVKDAAHALVFAGVSSGWSAFESAAKDIWIVALNSRPVLLAQPAFTKLPDETATESLSAKHISVGLLARHGFDLRDKLGLLLSDKFDFTGVSGIRVAYISAFGKSSVFDKMFSVQNLETLEATRHLIVHRAGFVDDDYRRRTKDNVPLGQQLPLDGARACELVNSSITICCNLIRQVDEWLVKHQ